MGATTLRRLVFVAMLGVAAALAPAASMAAELDPAQKRAMEKVIREYLLAHPEVIVDAMKRLESRRLAQEKHEIRRTLAKNRQQIERDPEAPVGGNVQGDVTVVEFFDYRCGVCRRVHPIVAKLVKDDSKIRRVYKEWPILGPESVYAAKAALASRYQGKYLVFHDALMETKAKLDENEVLAIAKRVGLDTRRLKRDMDRPEIDAHLRKNFAIADDLKLNGTPSFVIGDNLVRGGRDLQTMKHLVAQTRAARRKK